jgi:hypothetical protein
MKNSYYILFLFLLCLINVQAQNTAIKEFRTPQSVTISDGGPASPNATPIIKRLAEGYGKAPRSTFFQIEFDQVIRVNTREPNFVFRIESSLLRFKGDIKYKGFDVSEQLIPNELTYFLRMKRANGSFKDISISVGISDGKPELGDYNNNDSLAVGFTSYEIVNPVFRYGNGNALENRARLINDYYSAVVRMDAGFSLLQSIHPEQLDAFRMNQKNLLDAERILQESTAERFENKLPLTSNDPARYLEKRNAYQQSLQFKRNEMAAIWSTLHLTFYDKAMYHLKRNNLPHAEEFLNWSLEVNPAFTPALLQLAVIDYRRGNLHEAMCKADDILYNMPVEPGTRNNTFDLLRDIYSTYIEYGQTELSKKRYPKAIEYFESARNVCEKYPAVQCTNDLQSGLSFARSGIYNDILEEARDFIILNDLDRAESVTKDAIHYQQQYRNEVKDAAQSSNLLQAIRQKKYDNSIVKAIRFTDQRMYDAALNEFDKADSLLTEFQLTPSKNAQTAVIQAARPRALELLYEGESLVKSNQLTAARDAYRRSSDIQQRYGLLKDKDIEKHTSSLKKGIFTQQCINAQNDVDAAYNQGQQLEADGDFLAADVAYERGLKIARENSECGIAVDSIESAVMGIRPAVTYLDYMQSSRENDKNGRYHAAIEAYEKASDYFASAHVGTFGLDHDPDLYRYIREKGSAGLINYAGDLFRERGNLDQSLELYKLLLERNYDVKFLEGSLYQLGLKLGQRDKSLNPGSSWKDVVSRYTGGDKKLNRLKKGFKAGFRG